MNFRDHIISLLEKETGQKNLQLEIPPDDSLGDFAFPCFSLAKQFKKAPAQIAIDIAGQIEKPAFVSEVKATGPYVNFFLDANVVAKETINRIAKEKQAFGMTKLPRKVILIESPGPNTNKPLHLGHLRNMLLGASIQHILKAVGHDARIVNVVNDRGVHICKSMLAYEKFGDGATPQSTKKKSDHFVGDYYVEYAKQAEKNPELENEIQDLLVKWENNDPPTRALWKQMNEWALLGFLQTYQRLAFEIEKEYFESDTYQEGKSIVEKGAEDNIFQKRDDNAIVINLEDKKLGTKVLLRPNGTSVYITQDIAMARDRYDDFKFDDMVYVVGNEQEHHFRVLFEIFKRLDWPFADRCYHLSYGMVELPSGKMKSREGNVIDTDTLLDDLHQMAKEEIQKRHPDLSYDELEKRSRQIGLGAARFFFLKYNPKNNFVFQMDESLSVEGESGPYVMYAHARCFAILEKLGEGSFSADLVDPHEQRLAKLLGKYPGVVLEAASSYDPAVVAHYLLQLAQSFNSFYHACRIKEEEEGLKNSRLALVSSVRQVLQNGLSLLGIEAPNQM